MDNLEFAVSTCNTLKRMGNKLAIDDFGTGYSSLGISNLKSFPVDTLKIDRSFVKDLAKDTADLTVIKSILALAQGLNLKVVAEGVEDLAQLNILSDEGCDEGQGYYLGAPISATEFVANWLPSAREPIGTKRIIQESSFCT